MQTNELNNSLYILIYRTMLTNSVVHKYFLTS